MTLLAQWRGRRKRSRQRDTKRIAPLLGVLTIEGKNEQGEEHNLPHRSRRGEYGDKRDRVALAPEELWVLLSGQMQRMWKSNYRVAFHCPRGWACQTWCTLEKQLWVWTWLSGALLIACQRQSCQIPPRPRFPSRGRCQDAFVPSSPPRPQRKGTWDTSEEWG